jgi:hypothetical protein
MNKKLIDELNDLFSYLLANGLYSHSIVVNKAIAALSAKPEPLPEVEKYAALVLPHLAMYAVSHSEPMERITGRHFTSAAAELAVQFAKALVAELEKKSGGESK